MSDPIVFVPGLLCTEALFAPQISAFADRPIMVANHREHDSVEAIAQHLLETAPPHFSLIALSMGGYVAMEVLRRAPERVGKLALLSTNSRPDMPEQTKRRKFLIELTLKKGFTKVPHLLYPGFVHEMNEENEALKATVLEMALDTGPEAFIRQQTAVFNRIDSRPSLRDISCPTLILAGTGDRLTPLPIAEEIHRGIPGSELAALEDCGHLPTLEAPEKTTYLLTDFLNGT